MKKVAGREVSESPVCFDYLQHWLQCRGQQIGGLHAETEVKGRSLDIRLAGLTEHIHITLKADEIVIAAVDQEDCWDLLAFFEVVPKSMPDGVACALCLAAPDPDASGAVDIYPSEEALWISHGFEVFEEWVVNVLKPAVRLRFYGVLDQASAANLIPSEKMAVIDTHAVKDIAVWR